MTDRVARVLYVMGTGRSGSTLLGIALGNVPGAFYGGELFAWNHFRGRPSSDDIAVQAFWSGFRDGVDAEERCFDHDFFRELEHPSSLRRGPRRRRSDRAAHVRHNAALFRRIQEVTGADVVVDSSHFPLRGWLLSRNPALDVRIVHLVRDPRDVVNALQNGAQREVPMPPWLANAYCWVVALLSGIVLAGLPRRRWILVRYEDLVEDPSATLGRICRLAGLPEEDVGRRELVVGPVFQGNRLRHRATVTIRAQPDRDRLPHGWRLLTTVAQLPLLLAYGYLRSGRRRRVLAGAGGSVRVLAPGPTGTPPG